MKDYHLPHLETKYHAFSRGFNGNGIRYLESGGTERHGETMQNTGLSFLVCRCVSRMNGGVHRRTDCMWFIERYTKWKVAYFRTSPASYERMAIISERVWDLSLLFVL